MDSDFDDIYPVPDGPTRRHTFNGNPPVNRSTRSWTSNGVRYHVDSTSYQSPGFAFGITGSVARRQGQADRTSNRNHQRSPGILGSAMGFLGDLLQQKSQKQRQVKAAHHGSRKAKKPSPDHLAYGEDFSDTYSETLFSQFPDRSSSGSERSRQDSSGRTRSPPRRPGANDARRSRSYRARDPDPRSSRRAAFVEDDDGTESEESSDYSEQAHRQHRRAFTQNDAAIIETLDRAARHHRREADRCRDQIHRMSNHPSGRVEALQGQLNELRRHERAYESARENLKVMQSSSGGQASQARPRHQSSNHRSERLFFEPDPFNGFPPNDFHSNFFQRRQQHPFFDDFDPFAGTPFADLHRSFFNDFGGFGNRAPFGGDMPGFFSMPFDNTSSGPYPGARQQSGPRFQQQPGPGPSFSAPRQPTPPPNLLRPDEAKRLFQTYNERWNSLGPTDANIPYPARRLHPSGLVARDSIWAPMVSAQVAEWSEEIVMQANTQAFFLGVVGLTPQYTETPGSRKIVMGYNKAQATPGQVKELVDMLKKEKGRWHSDRLGRRNAGQTGTNEALQRDDKARAVFHAVCELMEAAQGS